MKQILLFLSIITFLYAGSSYALGEKLDTKKPIEITADTMEIVKKKDLAVFQGNVEAKQGDLDIRSNRMVVHYKKAQKEGEKNRVSKVEILGDVFISTPKETAQGEQGLFDVDQKEITLNGNVILTSGKNIVKGESLVYNLKTGRSKMRSGDFPTLEEKGKKSRVKGVFIPGS